MSFYRKPSPLELTYIGSDVPGYSPFVNQFFLEIDGELNLDHWQQAVEQASLANPGCRLVLKGFWGWKYWDDGGPLPLVKKVTTDWDGNSSQGAPFLGEPIDPRTGPNAQVILLDGEQPRVLFRTHHAITDGQGMVHWIKDIFRVLQQQQPLGSTGTNNDFDIASKCEYPPRTVKEGYCIPVTKASQHPELERCRWVRFNWQGKYTKIVPKLILALSRIAWRNNGADGKIIFRIPSDLRRYDDKDAPFSMANAIGTIDLNVDQNTTINSLHKDIISALRTKADLSAFPKNMNIVRWLPLSLFRFKPELLKKGHEEINYRMTGILSHLGEMDFTEQSGKNFTVIGAYGVPIPLENRAIFIGFSINKRMGLDAVVSMPKALASHEELLALCEEIKSELNTF